MNRIIVAGIHTEVGKTVVSAILAEALDGYYWKPVQCGLPADRDWVEGNLSAKGRCYPSTFSLSTPCSPHLAARRENIRINARDLISPTLAAPLIIEGTGGLLAPLNATESWADAAVHWKAQWVLVHRHYLGSLNHFALTIEAMEKRKIPLLGVIFNGEGDSVTEEMLLKKAASRCLGRLPWQEQFSPAIIRRIAKEWKETILLALGR